METRVRFSLTTKMALAVTIILWASAFVGIRVGLRGYGPGSLALLRFFIASICMGIIYWRLPQRASFKWQDFVLLVLFGAIGLGGYNVFLNQGEISVASGVSSFLISQSPLLTLLFAVIFLKEEFNPGMLAGILISIAGVGLIAFGEHQDLNFDKGFIALLIATLLSGLYSVLQKPFLNKYHAIDVTVYIIWGCTLALFIYLPDLLHDIKTASATATGAVVYLGIFPAAVAYLAWSYALSAIPASICSTYLYFMPIIATFLGWLLLGEIPTLMSFLGGLVALLGVWIANRAFAKGG